MKRIPLMMAVAGLAGGSFMLGGCETLTQTPGENWNTIVHAQDTTWKQVHDDWQTLLLLNKPIRLSDRPVPSH